MKHAWKELIYGKRKFILIELLLILLMFMVLFLTGLDSERGHKAVEMIRNAVKKRGKAAVIVTHDERILDLMDRIYRLENGVLLTASAVSSAGVAE